MKKRGLLLMAACLILSVFFSSTAVVAAPYYEGKTMRIIVGFAPGGGYDRLARLLAKHLPKHIAGGPNIIVENMEGASSIIAANHIFNIAKPDGLTIGAVNRGVPFAQLTKVEGVKFDITKFSWIGSAASEATILALRTDSPYKSMEAMRQAKEPVPLAGMGPGTSDTQFAILLKEFCGANVKVIVYPSSADGMLAIERKEVEGRAGSYSSLKPFIDRGLVQAVLRGRVAEQGIENLPVIEDFTTDPVGKTIMAMLAAADRIGRPYIAPPGTPPEVITILREAFAKVSKDAVAQEEANKIKMAIEYTPAEETLKTLDYLMNQPDNVVKEFSKFIKF